MDAPDSVSRVIGVVQDVVLALTFVALVWYAWETRLLRLETAKQVRETAKQVRLYALPILQIIFHKGPDKVFLRNVSTTSAASSASRALLQGFRFSWNDAAWQCTFEPTGMIVPGQETRLEVHIEEEPVDAARSRSVPANQVFTTAFRHALSIGRPNMGLALHYEDMLGSCYRSEVQIDWTEMTSERQETRPPISRTSLVERFPESLELVDMTTHPHALPEPDRN